MLNSLNMVNNYTGIDFENGCVELLEHCGFKASKTSEEDRGVDIIASITTNENVKKYYIDRQGLAGILIGALSGNQEFVTHNLQTSIVKVDSRETIKSIVIDEFDKLLKYRKEADQLRQQASILEQKAIIMQREEMLNHLGFL